MPLPRWLATSTNGYSTPLRCAGAHLPSFLPQARFPLPGSDYSEKCVVKTAEHVWSTSKSWGRRAPGLQVWSFVTTPNRGSYETTPVQVTKPPARDRKRFLAGGFAVFWGGRLSSSAELRVGDIAASRVPRRRRRAVRRVTVQT